MVAVGPGCSGMLTLQGRDTLLGADLAVGFATVLDVVRPWLEHAEVRPMTYRDQEQVLEYAAEQAKQGRRCVVCCWGDLTVSASELLDRVRRNTAHVKLVHSVSSVQVAMSRAGVSLEDVIFITLHRRAGSPGDLDELVHYINEGRRHVVLLPRPFDLMPAAIAGGLMHAGVRADLPVQVFQRLTLEDEGRWVGDLGQCGKIVEDLSDLSIMVFLCGGTANCEGD